MFLHYFGDYCTTIRSRASSTRIHSAKCTEISLSSLSLSMAFIETANRDRQRGVLVCGAGLSHRAIKHPKRPAGMNMQ